MTAPAGDYLVFAVYVNHEYPNYGSVEAVLDRHGIDPGLVYRVYRTGLWFGTRLTADQYATLRSDRGIGQVVPDRPGRPAPCFYAQEPILDSDTYTVVLRKGTDPVEVAARNRVRNARPLSHVYVLIADMTSEERDAMGYDFDVEFIEGNGVVRLTD